MTDHMNPPPDLTWDIAWTWVQKQHDPEQFTEASRAELMRWLAQDVSHRQAYDRASRLWLLTGLVPPSGDFDLPGDE